MPLCLAVSYIHKCNVMTSSTEGVQLCTWFTGSVLGDHRCTRCVSTGLTYISGRFVLPG